MYAHILDAIGNTPLVKIPFDSPASIYAKLEYLNPGGSVKDRSARYMIEQAEKKGLLQPGGIIIDASSGNQGISSAMIGALKGYKVIIVVSDKISQEKLQTIQAYGAKVIMVPSTKFIDDQNSYHYKAKELHKNTPNSFMPDQYYNLENTMAHYTNLGPEIWRQTNGNITHFFAGAGTGGTVSGVGRYLKQQNPNVKIIAIDTATSFRATNGNPKPYKIEGIGIDFETPVMDFSVIDEIIPVTDDDAFAMLKVLARRHGILAGLSSGAIAHAAAHYTKKLSTYDYAVMIFGDSGRAYLTKNVY